MPIMVSSFLFCSYGQRLLGASYFYFARCSVVSNVVASPRGAATYLSLN